MDKNIKLVALRIITLMYVDAALRLFTANNEKCKKLLAYVKVPEVVLGMDNDRSTIILLKDLAEWMLGLLELNEAIPTVDFKMRLEQVSQHEPWIKEVMEDVIALKERDDVDALTETQKTIGRELFSTLAALELEDVVRGLYKTAIFDNGVKDSHDFAVKAIEKFSPFLAVNETLGSGNSQGTVSTMNRNAALSTIKAVMAKDDQKRNGNMILKTGYHCINEMLRGGPRMGELIVNIAMRFNFKSGLLVNIFRQLPKYNKPFPCEDGRKPTLVFITFEADLSALLFMLYAGIVENTTREPLTYDELTLHNDDKAEIIFRYFDDLGWHVVLHHQNPMSWTYEHLFNFTEGLEKEGCRIVGLFADYLYQVPKTGCQVSQIIGEDTKAFYTRVRAYYKLRDVLVWTPHQMSTKARSVMDFNTGLLVENVVGKGMLEGCGSIDNCVDAEIYQHKETDRRTGMDALSLLRGKHKLEGEAVKEHLLAMLWFNQYKATKSYYSGILDDVGYGAMHSRKLSDPPLSMQRESVSFDGDEF